jgi:hypothetical protein
MATEANPNHAGVNRRRFLITSGAMGAGTLAAGISSWPAVGDPDAKPAQKPPPSPRCRIRPEVHANTCRGSHKAASFFVGEGWDPDSNDEQGGHSQIHWPVA